MIGLPRPGPLGPPRPGAARAARARGRRRTGRARAMGHRGVRGAMVAAALGLIAASGCNRGGSVTVELIDPYPGVALRVAVLGDPALAEALDARRGEWER